MNHGGILKALLLCSALLFSSFAFSQYEGDDVYDPFADYSEFEENSQEEADINFFRNGRFFNVALLLGGRMFTGGMASNMEAAPSPGLALTYWFNLRLALQFSYVYSQHIIGPIVLEPANASSDIAAGNLSLTSLAFDLKYYLNTNNVTRGLANLNPFLLFGFSQNSRSFSFVDSFQVGKDEGAGFDFGGGIEIPIARNEMFIGVQFVYTYVNFASENNPIPDSDPAQYFDGDMMNLHFIFGFNFL